MREIKFRAWTEPENKMINWNSLLRMNLYNIFVIPEQCGVILMQYTGLKDKNGKEIYEGDIIQTEELTAVIEYSEIYAEYITTNTNQIQYEDEPLGDLRGEEIEVIGNIYENPDLLEKGKEE